MKDKLVKIGLFALGAVSLLIASFTNAAPYHGSAVGIQLTSIPFRIDLTSYTCYTTDTTNTYTYSFDNSSFISFGKRDLVCGRPGDTIWFGGQYNGWILSFPGIPEMTKAQCKTNYNLIEPSECSVMSSLECQTTYSLIPLSSVDQSYCESNNLCPTSGGGSGPCESIYSNLYINDIFHPGAFNIVVNIPEEIDRDYAYTNSGYNFNLDVAGYNVDYEKIQNIVDTQSYKPTSEDFTKLVSNFGSYGGLLVACLFVILLFYFILKIFK